jgi:hypothetical protein
MFRKLVLLGLITFTLAFAANYAQLSLAADQLAKVKFKNQSGAEFALAGTKHQGELVDGSEKVSFSVSADGKVIEIQSGGKSIGFVSMPNANEWKIKDATKRELYELKREADGHYKLKDGAGIELYKVKSESYGWKIKDKTDQAIYKVHNEDGKISLKSASGAMVAETKAGIPPIALACFGFDALSKPQKAALAYALSYLQ